MSMDYIRRTYGVPARRDGQGDMMSRVIVCNFSGALADLPKGQRTPLAALQVLERHPRVSTFDRGEMPWLNRLLGDLLHQGLIVQVDEPYPWHRYELAATGRQMLGAVTAKETT
jgi:hypothetical protein